jgi:hypothetical protein
MCLRYLIEAKLGISQAEIAGFCSYDFDGGGKMKAIQVVLMAVQVCNIVYGADFLSTDLTILDNSTSLMWTRDSNVEDGSSWRVMKRWNDAFKLVEQLNEKKYAGYSDWRVPTIEELKTLANYAKRKGLDKGIAEYGNDPRRDGYVNELFREIGFKNVQADHHYWSSTEASDTEKAKKVAMDGYGGDDDKDYFFYVWPVRTDLLAKAAETKRLAEANRLAKAAEDERLAEANQLAEIAEAERLVKAAEAKRERATEAERERAEVKKSAAAKRLKEL